MPHPIMFRDDDLGLAEVRKIALGFPEAFEKISWGRPVFCAPKMFVMYGGSAKTDTKGEIPPVPVLDPGQGRRERPQGTRTRSLGSSTPPTWARRAGSGWTSRRRKKVDWDEVRELIDASFRMVAPKKLIKQLDEV